MNFKTYILGFLFFSLAAGISFFVGFKLGKSMAKEEFRKEVMRTKETELEDILHKIFKSAELKAQQGDEKNLETVKKSEETAERKVEAIEQEAQSMKKEVIQTEEDNRNVEPKSDTSESSLESEPKKGQQKKEETDVSSEAQSESTATKGFLEETREEEKEVKTPRNIERGRTITKKESETANIPKKLRDKNIWESGGKWTVQVASFDDHQKASKYAEELKRKYGLPSYVIKASKNSKVVWRVRIGKMKSRSTAEELRKFLQSEGIEGIVTF